MRIQVTDETLVRKGRQNLQTQYYRREPTVTQVEFGEPRAQLPGSVPVRNINTDSYGSRCGPWASPVGLVELRGHQKATPDQLGSLRSQHTPDFETFWEDHSLCLDIRII